MKKILILILTVCSIAGYGQTQMNPSGSNSVANINKAIREPAVAAGTDTYTTTIIGATLSSKHEAYTIEFTNANTGSSTLNINDGTNNLGAVTLKKFSSGSLVNLASGDISAGQSIRFRYNGTNFVMEGGSGSGGASGALLAANNLSDLASASTARTNLGLGTLATQSGTFSGTSSGTNTGDQDLSGLMVKSANLFDLTSVSTARTNLGLGTAALISSTAGGDLSGTLPSPTVTKINGTSLAGLATGILKNTTSTGVPSIAVAGDFPTLNQNTTGTAANLSGTPALPNGTTVTTQSPGDATTKIANDAFVSAAIAAAALGPADATHDGFLTQTDFTNFTNKLSANQTITFTPTGDVTGSASGATSLTPALSIGAGKVTNTMLAGSIDLTTKVTGVLPIANGGTGSTAGAWLLSGTSNISGNTTQSGAFTNTSALNGELITQNALSSGWIPSLKITPGAHTLMTAGTEFPVATIESSTQTHATGALTTQRDFWVKAQTHAFAGASTLSTAYGAYFERPIAGTNATITKPYALGTNGDVKITTATATSTDYGLEVVTNTSTNAFRVTGNAITQLATLNSFGTGNDIKLNSGNTTSSSFTFGHLNNVALNSNNLINTAGLLALTQNSTLNCTMLRLAQTINNSGSGPYNLYAIHYIPTETSMTSTNHYSFVSDSQTALGGVGTATPTERWEVVGNTKTNHLIGRTSAPTIAAGTGAGTSPTVVITNGTDISGIVDVTTGTTPAGTNAIIATITFNSAYGAAPNIQLTPNNANAAGLAATLTMVYVTSTTTTFVITSGTTALTASTQYKWFYTVVQ